MREAEGLRNRARDEGLAQAIDELVKHLAEEAGVTEEQACAAVKRRHAIVPRRQRERRKRARELLLLIFGVFTLLVTLAAVHLVLTQH